MENELALEKKLSEYNLKKRLRRDSQIDNQILVNIDAQGNEINEVKDSN